MTIDPQRGNRDWNRPLLDVLTERAPDIEHVTMGQFAAALAWRLAITGAGALGLGLLIGHAIR